MTYDSIFIDQITAVVSDPFYVHIVILILNKVNKVSLVIPEENKITGWVGFYDISSARSWALVGVVVSAWQDVQGFEFRNEFLAPEVQVFVLRVDLALQFKVCNPPDAVQAGRAELLFEFSACFDPVFALVPPVDAQLLQITQHHLLRLLE